MNLITSVRAASGREYEIDQDGFIPGSLQYADRDYRFDYVPDIALGVTHIRTAGRDKMIQESEICMILEVSLPVTVFIVFADKLRLLPGWLEDFVGTREKVTWTDSNTSTLKGIFTLFAKDFQPGSIILYGNLSPAMLDDPTFRASGPGGANYCMYSVAVKKRAF